MVLRLTLYFEPSMSERILSFLIFHTLKIGSESIKFATASLASLSVAFLMKFVCVEVRVLILDMFLNKKKSFQMSKFDLKL